MNIFWKSVASLAFACTVACGGPLKYQVASGDKAKGADAAIVADVKSAEHQTVLEIKVKNLAPPGRITEGATQFTVWGRKSSSSPWARIGNLTYDEGARDGKFNGTYPEIEFDLEISVEKEGDPASPSSDIVFSQHIGPA